MKNLILRWWFRKWSNWEFDGVHEVFTDDYSKRPIATYDMYKSTSSDGLARYKRVRR